MFVEGYPEKQMAEIFTDMRFGCLSSLEDYLIEIANLLSTRLWLD